MTEAEWFSCTDPHPMLAYLALHATDRKLRLFACAFARLAGDALADPSSRQSIETSERYADGDATADELKQSWAAASRAAQGAIARRSRWDLLAVALAEARDAARGGAWAAAHSVIGDAISGTDRHAAADILRHIFSNPFGPPSERQSFPPAVVQFAAVVYAGDATVAGRLKGALMDVGRAELAGHFGEQLHPKGCFALDLILGKS